MVICLKYNLVLDKQDITLYNQKCISVYMYVYSPIFNVTPVSTDDSLGLMLLVGATMDNDSFQYLLTETSNDPIQQSRNNIYH